jgi:DNA-binding NtrC family response regulator
VVDVRIICATHKDLREEIRKGTFRQDLYYRLNVSMIKLPPLREHPEDIPELLEAFMYKFATRKGGSKLRVDPSVIDILQGYGWPGNIREFQNVVERMLHSVQGAELSAHDIPEEILWLPEPPVPPSPGQARIPGSTSLREQLLAEEREKIQTSLRTWNGNMTKAAQELGMARNTLYRKLQKLSI